MLVGVVIKVVLVEVVRVYVYEPKSWIVKVVEARPVRFRILN